MIIIMNTAWYSLVSFTNPLVRRGTFPGTAWLDTLLVYPVTLCITLVSSAYDICKWPLFIHFCLFLGPSGNIWLLLREAFQNPNGRIHVYGEQKLPKFGSDPPPSSIADRKLCWCFAWLLLKIHLQQESITIIINSEGRWAFVMWGNMTCPQTMGCWFLQEAGPLPSTACRPPFTPTKNFLFCCHIYPGVCWPQKSQFLLFVRKGEMFLSLVFSRLLVWYRVPSCPPQNKWWYADLTFWTVLIPAI